MLNKLLKNTIVRQGLIVGFTLVIAAVLAIVACDRWVASTARDRLFTAAADVPGCDVALVLGTSPLIDGERRNLFFEYRMDAAAGLFAAGRVRHLIVSGDNHTRAYDEPTAMRDALVQRGVPESAITLDYAGFRTLDSVVRAGTVFGQDRIVVVSQHFHCERAIFIADARGIDAVGYVARSPGGRAALKVRLREAAARTGAVVDTCVLSTAPRFAGPPEPIVLAGAGRSPGG